MNNCKVCKSNFLLSIFLYLLLESGKWKPISRKFISAKEKEILALGGEFHSDCYEALIENGSQAGNVWGFNIFPDLPKERCLEFTSLINIRPNLGNRSMEIQNEEIRQKISKIIEKIILWN